MYKHGKTSLLSRILRFKPYVTNEPLLLFISMNNDSLQKYYKEVKNKSKILISIYNETKYLITLLTKIYGNN